MEAYMIEGIDGSFSSRIAAENAIEDVLCLGNGETIKAIEFDWDEQKMFTYEITVIKYPYDSEMFFEWKKVS